MTDTITPRQRLIKQVRTMLGNNLIEVDLETEDYNTAVDLALDYYRQRSENAVEECGFFLTLTDNKQIYTLPSDIIEVTEILRRGLSSGAGNSVTNQYDPFTLAYTNLYLLQPSGQGDLLTYETYHQYLETAGRMFGSKYDFRWDDRTHKLLILRNTQHEEEVLLKAYKQVPEELLLDGTYSKAWLRSYTLAQCKLILGQAYEKFSNVPGPTGSVTLNGAALKAEAVAELAALEEQLRLYSEGGRPLGFILG